MLTPVNSPLVFYPTLLLGLCSVLIFSAGAFCMKQIGLLDVLNVSNYLQWKSEIRDHETMEGELLAHINAYLSNPLS